MYFKFYKNYKIYKIINFLGYDKEKKKKVVLAGKFKEKKKIKKVRWKFKKSLKREKWEKIKKRTHSDTWEKWVNALRSISLVSEVFRRSKNYTQKVSSIYWCRKLLKFVLFFIHNFQGVMDKDSTLKLTLNSDENGNEMMIFLC